jgi:hypothetical protein
MTRTFARSLMRILVVHRYAQIYTDIHVVRYYSSTNTLPINAPLDRHPTPRVGGRMYNRRYLHVTPYLFFTTMHLRSFPDITYFKLWKTPGLGSDTSQKLEKMNESLVSDPRVGVGYFTEA